jgi:hypothetical protein
MECWICGNEGKTGEHLIKASDLKSYFGEISESRPVYHHSDEKRNVKIKSIKSDKLKSDALICANCNNNLSQPYDRAWEKLSSYLRKNWKKALIQEDVPLKEIFQDEIEHSMLNVQLFFVKLFGCRIIENKIPIDIKMFSQAFLNRKTHKNIFIYIEKWKSNKNVGMSEINALTFDNIPIFAHWLYIIDELVVNIIYDTKRINKKLLRKCWTPKNHGNKLQIHKDLAS